MSILTQITAAHAEEIIIIFVFEKNAENHRK
jgi:hypothetical protein